MKRGSPAIKIFAGLPLILFEVLFGQVEAWKVFKTRTLTI